ncbi:hypothetical protein GM921_09680 [Pedobacter sp. LMG 31464]|uniref:Uncharacterized protein n=1 Tax=Pedobacter planticolens TaxID=2679964 RepID=A0A923IV89_9SPHI|nr:hypothetical protein [Pedobacter planticolens]MBB2145756.1 hypothetical protein [Pedobacter planticolens]
MTTNIFEFKLELLKKELDTIHQSIARLDEASMKIKNWAILIWAGSISIVLGSNETELRKVLLFVAVIPLLFWLVEGKCRRRQRHFIFRSQEISTFINSSQFTEVFKSEDFGSFNLMGIMAWDKESSEVIAFTSLKRILWFGSIRNFYCGLIAITIILQVILYPKSVIVKEPKPSNYSADSILMHQQTQILEGLIKLNMRIDSLRPISKPYGNLQKNDSQ